MPAFSFKKEFVNKILNGTKLSTIRPLRKDKKIPCFAGDTITLYTGMRTQHCKQLLVALCRECYIIRIADDCFFTSTVWKKELWDNKYHWGTSDERCILGKELDALAFTDGFDSWSDMLSWFKRVHAKSFRDNNEFRGFMFEWVYPEYMKRKFHDTL